MEPDQLQHGRPTASVIAQQYSSVTLFSLRLHSLKEKIRPVFSKTVNIFDARLKNISYILKTV
jgi:hypothetical protein